MSDTFAIGILSLVLAMAFFMMSVVFSLLRKAFLVQVRMADEIQQLATEVRQLTTRMNEEAS